MKHKPPSALAPFYMLDGREPPLWGQNEFVAPAGLAEVYGEPEDGLFERNPDGTYSLRELRDPFHDGDER